MNKILLSITAILSVFLSFAQISSPLCSGAENVCANNGSNFIMSTAGGYAVPSGNTISNPQTNPQGVNSGCFLSNGPNPNWFVINIGQSGNLEFVLGAAGGSGFFDWVLWPYDPMNPASSCNGIQNNTLAPVSCNWNAASAGFTGMWNGGTPAGGNSGNFQPSIPVVAGQAYVLAFSNYSFLPGNTQLSFPSNPGSAVVTCTPGTPDQTICLGNSATVNLVSPIQITSANWLVTTGVSNPSGWTNVIVTPTVTTEYIVEMTLAGGAIVHDTFMINVVNPPMPNAGADQTVCMGQPISLSGTLGNTSNSHSWQVIAPTGLTPPATASFSPNFTSMTPTVTVNQPGVYNFILKETSTLCGIVRDTVQVTVSQLVVSTTPTNPTCAGYSDGYITITSAGATEYSFDNGTTWGASNTQGGFAAGSYTVYARNAMGCQKSATVVLTDPAPIVISVSNDTLICENGTADMLASATGGASYTYHWSHTASNLASQQVSPTVSAYYPVYAESDLGCLSEPDSIRVDIRPGLSGTMSADPYTCPGYPESLTVTPSGGIGAPYTMVWNTSQTDMGSSSTLQDNPQTTTIYTVTISDACETTPITLQGTINAYPLPVPMIAADAQVKCEPAVFDLYNDTDPNMVQNTIWRISNGEEFIDVNSLTTSAMMAGNYTVQLIVMSPDGCIDSATFTNYLTVQATPIADFKWSPDPVTMFNTQVLFTNYSWNADSYQWFFTDATPATSTNEDQTVLFPDGQTGTYDVMLIATSYLGCSDTVIKQVNVLPEVILYAPNAFTPDGDEFNQSWRIYIEGIDLYDFDLQIYDRWGEMVWESHDPEASWDGTYHGKIVPYGAYTWVIRTRDILTDKKFTWNGDITVIR